MNGFQRKCAVLTLTQAVSVAEFVLNDEVAIAGITISVDLLKKAASNAPTTLGQ